MLISDLGPGHGLAGVGRSDRPAVVPPAAPSRTDLAWRAQLDQRLGRLTSTAQSTWRTAFVLCLLVYLSTAHWYGVTNLDTIGAAWPGWEFAHHGHFWLENDPRVPDIAWFSEVNGHLVSNRMAGVVLAGVPAQLLLAPFGVSALTPAILTGVVFTAAAMANLCLLLLRCGGGARTALACTTAVAFGTGFWPNASAELWPHGPDAFWLSLAMLALQRRHLWLVGVSLVPAIWTRPHLALVAACLGGFAAAEHRSWRPLLHIGLPTAAGAAGLVAWNNAMFGRPSIEGGYTGHLQNVLATAPQPKQFVESYLESVAGTLVSPMRGLLVFSPFVVLALFVIVKGFARNPQWPNACLCGGVVYQLAQWRLNNFSGGTGFFSYRLPLELLVLGAPAAYLGYLRMRARSRRIVVSARALVGASVAIHAIGVYWFLALGRQGQDQDLWTTWGVAFAARSRGTAGLVIAVGVAALILAAAMVHLHRPDSDSDSDPDPDTEPKPEPEPQPEHPREGSPLTV